MASSLYLYLRRAARKCQGAIVGEHYIGGGQGTGEDPEGQDLP